MIGANVLPESFEFDEKARASLAAGAPPPRGIAEVAPPLLVGMYASVEIQGRHEGRYAVVPRRALRDASTLWLVDAEDRVSIRRVRLLSESENRAVVSADGLPDGARVIVSDLKIVTQDMPVRVVEAPSPAASPAPASGAGTVRAAR